jgi:hypothetical protein
MTETAAQTALLDLDPLSVPETIVRDAIAKGLRANLAPDGTDTDRTIRAAFVRAMAIGASGTQRGVRIENAIIDGPLDLDFSTLDGRLVLSHCQIAEGLSAREARLTSLDLSGSKITSLDLSGMTCTGDVLLTEGFRASEGARLQGASIGGDLSCIRGSFANEGDPSFDAHNLRVADVFYWRDVSVDKGAVVLTGAQVGALADNLKSWPDNGQLMIDGFTYGRIVYGDTSAARRLKWLEKHASNDFQPQPYQQLAKVIGEMGHRHDRSRVMMVMERKFRAQQARDILSGGDFVWAPLRQPYNYLRAGLHSGWDKVLRYLVGYGYRPWWALWWALPLIIAMAVFAQKVWDEGDFAPNAPPALMSASWQSLATDSSVANPAAVWSCTPPNGADDEDYPCQMQAGRDYETFKSHLYAIDLFVPLINLGQEDAWAPSTSRGDWGRAAHQIQWLVKIIGWVITALVAGAVAGIIRND